MNRSLWMSLDLLPLGIFLEGMMKDRFQMDTVSYLLTRITLSKDFSNNGSIQPGKIRILYSNGEFYEGDARFNGIRHGEGAHYYANGDIYDGEFVDNVRIGKSRLRFHDGSEYIGQFIDDMADGTGLFNDKEGNRFMTLAEDDEHK